MQQSSNPAIQQFKSYIIMQQQPSHILVIRTGALGDTIVMSGVYQALRKQYPAAWIEALGHVERLQIINTPGLINRLTSIDAASFSVLFLDNAQIPDQLRKYFQQFDAILLYSVDPENTIQSNLCKICAQKVYAFDPFPPPGENIHITAYLLRTLEVLGIDETMRVPEIAFPETTANISPFDNVCATIHPGSGSAKKNWPVEYFAQICQRLIEEYQASITVLVGPADTFDVDALVQPLPAHAVDILQNRIVEELALHLRQCQLYLGNDSGISHLAAAVGVPSVILFGPSNPHVWRPIGPCVQVIQGDGRPYCQGISVEDVWQAVKNVFPTTHNEFATDIISPRSNNGVVSS